MKKVLFISLLLISLAFIQATAQQSNIFPKGEIATNTENYTGKIWLNILSPADSTFHFNVDVATYHKGSRLDWHIHPAGQILLISEGTGYYQEKGKQGQIIHQGDIVKCPPCIEHWHAAAPNSSFAYIAITPTDKGKTIWLQDVTDEEYNSVKASHDNKQEKKISLSKRKQSLKNNKNAFIIQEQGSFAVGGTIVQDSGVFDPIKDGSFNPGNQSTTGQSLHGDHAFVWYQKPANARDLPLVFWHGYSQFMKTWQTTPDGREGFQNIFLRRRYPVYLIDQPRRGSAGRSTKSGTINASPDDQLWFGIFRLGTWPNFYSGVQFSKDSEALNQFYRQMTPDTGPLDFDVNIKAVSALFDKIDSAILVTHSQSGGQGWLTAIENAKIKGIISFEPFSNFVFPEGEVPDPISFVGGKLAGKAATKEDFMKLTQIPIIIYYGDNIPNHPVNNPGQDQWRAGLEMAKKWTNVVNQYGGDVTLIHLPEIGITGNTHFIMSDLNNVQIADLMSKWMNEKGLDKGS